jgi:uncharacterized protein (DUF2252 family)
VIEGDSGMVDVIADRPSGLPVVEHPTPEERSEAGKRARAEVPRSSHGEWAPAPGRPDPVDLLLEQDATRVPELVPIRHGRMSESAFTFFRGGALLMASDLAPHPRTSLTVQLCGDAHLSNFGIYAAADRRLVFSINDFDETLPGPFEWDVKRLAASLAVAGRSREFSDAERATVIAACVGTYRLAMREFAQLNTLDLWYLRLDVEEVMGRFLARATKEQRRNLERILTKARSKTSLKAVSKLTHEVDGELRILSDPPLVVPMNELLPHDRAVEMTEAMREMFRIYRASLADDRQALLERYRFVDLARKVVGVGSVGTRAWVVLMTGRDEHDPLMLQLKEAKRSVLEPYAGRSRYTYKGQRVVQGQRSMQSASDPLLGWYRLRALDGRMHDFYVRQLWDGKASIDVGHLDADGLVVYAATCGWTLARAHARTGPRISIATYLGEDDEFDQAIADFASTYADLTEDDHARLVAAIATGRLPATDELI